MGTEAPHSGIPRTMKPHTPQRTTCAAFLAAVLLTAVCCRADVTLESPLQEMTDYATLRFQVNGQNVARTFDDYAPAVQPAPAFALGTLEPRDRKFKLRLEITGVNPAAKGAKYLWGLDHMILEKP